MTLRDMLFGKRTAETFSPLSPTHQKRQRLFAAYWNYYRGHHKKPLRVDAGRPDDNVTLNYSKRVVNKSVQFLFGKPIEFEIDGESKGRNPQEQYLDAVWGITEEKQTLLQQIALNGGVCGAAFVRLYPPDPAIADGLPRIDNIDPSLVDVLVNPDDIKDIRAYHIVWSSNKVWKRHRIDMQEDGTWHISEEIATATNRWEPVDDHAWPYPFAPVVWGQNLPLPNSIWGMSDLEEADLNDAINFSASNTNRIIRFHAHPKTIGTGFNAKALEATAVDEFWTIPDPGARVANLEMQSDLASSQAFMQMLRNAYSKVTGIPELDPGQVNVGALSGFALKILYGDLLELTAIKRNTYGALLAEINKRVLALGGLAEYGTVEVQNVWQDPLPRSDLEQAQTLEIDRRNGLSQETYLEKRGYDPEREQERNAAAQQRQGTIGEELLRAFEGGRNIGLGDSGRATAQDAGQPTNGTGQEGRNGRL